MGTSGSGLAPAQNLPGKHKLSGPHPESPIHLCQAHLLCIRAIITAVSQCPFMNIKCVIKWLLEVINGAYVFLWEDTDGEFAPSSTAILCDFQGPLWSLAFGRSEGGPLRVPFYAREASVWVLKMRGEGRPAPGLAQGKPTSAYKL